MLRPLLRITQRLAVASLITILATAWPTFAAADGPELETGFVDVDGGRLYYETTGDGPAVVFLHDGLLHSGTWDEQIGPWSRRYRVIRYDRRGYGQSPPPEAPYSELADLLALLDALEVDTATLVGASSGGRLATDFTIAHPERVRSLVLVGAVVGGMGYSTHFRGRNLRNSGSLYTGGTVEEAITRWVEDRYSTVAGHTAARARVREILEANPQHLTGTGGRFAEQPDFEALERLGEIHVPTLILVGAEDIPDAHAHAGVLETGIPGAKRVVVPDAGHLVHLEVPEVFNELALDFLAPAEELAEKVLASVERLDAEALLPLFDYDRQAPLGVEEVGRESRDTSTVVDLSYASPAGGRVPAFLVLPPGEGPHPAVVLVDPGGRSGFLDEAVELAGLGVASLSIDVPQRRPDVPRSGEYFNAEEDRRLAIQLVVDLRRAVDLLNARDEIDSERIAYVGGGAGATYGGVLAGVETRFAGFVLIAGHPSNTFFFRHGEPPAFRSVLTPEEQARYVERNLPLDAVHYIHRAAPTPILFQFDTPNQYITEAVALAYFELAGEPKTIDRYDSDDDASRESARERRRRWLEKVLGLRE